ncbi:hypothetical protein [Ruegeria sp. ANG-R]|uniref:hypothetical protein n=1 Tax=Ruegeria sp. ANG-R TaxID=1577903 RepID=UPI001269CFB3|nr:hypothetical protein [Ruegeria sp. ANG-R]
MLSDVEKEQARLAATFKRKAQDFDDLQNEIAGRDNGRAARFFKSDKAGGRLGKSRDAGHDEALTLLQQLLMDDPEYAALYNETFELLADAESATEIALEKANQRLSQEIEAFNETLDSAARLDDGRVVFRDAQGRVWTSAHEQLTDIDADAVDWPHGASSYEEFKRQSEAVDTAQKNVDAILHYQVNVLGAARDRMSDADDPPSKEELQDIQDAIREQMPPQVRAEFEGANIETPAFSSNTNFDIPTL